MVADQTLVAKIDAVQAEYSAFETIHETDGLIEAVKEIGAAYVAYSPLGHGWLVEDFPFRSPDDFAPDDFRRSCKLFSGECQLVVSQSDASYSLTPFFARTAC